MWWWVRAGQAGSCVCTASCRRLVSGRRCYNVYILGSRFVMRSMSSVVLC